MKIWIVNAQENPPEPRSKIGRRQWRSNSLSEVLSDRGHSVIRWRSSFSHQKKQQLTDKSEIVKLDNYQQQFIYGPSYINHVGWKRNANHLKLASEFLKLAELTETPDVINVCNVPLELCHACIVYGNKHNVPVIIDIRDLWPDSYINFIPNRLSLLKNPMLWLLNRVFRKVTESYTRATALTAITQPILDWGLQKVPRERGALDAVFPMAYPSLTQTESNYDSVMIREKFGASKNSLIACYCGNIGFQTDFDTFFSAAEALNAVSVPIHFVIAGSGPRELELRTRASSMSNVMVTGWLSGTELAELFHVSSFGLIGFFNITDYMISLPNKFSEYLAAGLALVCGTEGEMAKLINKFECGIIYESMSSQSLVDGLTILSGSILDVERIKSNSRNLHKSQFDHDVVIPRIADHTERVGLRIKHHIRREDD
jgi:glycosyltransferase involved in cell wall biosynthesis